MSAVVTPGSGINHVREVAVLIYSFNESMIKFGELRVQKHVPPKDFKSIRVSNSNYVLDDHAVLIYTGLTFPQLDFSRNKNSSHALETSLYRIELLVNTTSLANESLNIEPQWMKESMEHIGALILYDLAIPGTYQSGAYRRYTHADVEDELVRAAYCQEEDVLTQLMFGIRYLDLRPVAVMSWKLISPKSYWIYNGKLPTGHLLDHILEDIRYFLEQFPKEVVFINFNIRFHSTKDYDNLKKLVDEKLGSQVYPRINGTTLHFVMRQRFSKVVEENHRAIVMYRNHHSITGLVLPGVVHIKAKNYNTDIVRVVLEHKLSRQRASFIWFFNLIAVPLVPIRIFPESNREIAHRMGLKISSWLYHDSAFWQNINIISVYYFLGSDIVSLCKELNVLRISEPPKIRPGN
ncbi:PI-PLC X domain-containing protein 3-like [Tropilaelaps mercedesae]|uniref:PI-PLC X domain-containing protein 3-like n=1 Tax=Tropilaelaps mercedesae TaxID=418985 RepID=A0A1V9X775_9ACAR|nr:PI-PLC X domain-containing protein 3-like [Tropilaelaps mercedesae]